MDLRGHLDLLLLATLQKTGPVHGYGLIGALDAGSDGIFELPEGTVYPALHRLERDGLVTSSWHHRAPRARRVYTLTREGEAAVAVKATAWQRFAEGVAAVLEPGPVRRLA